MTRRRITTREKPPAPMVQLAPGGRLLPVTPFDQEEIARLPIGTQFDLVSRTVRSRQQERLYWSILTKVAEATGRWPGSRQLHRDLLLSLNYTEVAFNFRTDKLERVPEPTRVSEMSNEEFKDYFNRAMALLHQNLGFDPIEHFPPPAGSRWRHG